MQGLTVERTAWVRVADGPVTDHGRLVTGPSFVLDRDAGVVFLAHQLSPVAERCALGLALSYVLDTLTLN